MRSIERTLLVWNLGALSLGSLLLALVTCLVTLDEMREVFDANLKNVADAVAACHGSSVGAEGPPTARLPQRDDTPTEYEIVTVTWTPDGQRVFSSDPRVNLPFTKQEGLMRPHVGGEDWIVHTSVAEHGVAQAAQRLSARKDRAAESAQELLPPMLLLVLVVAGLLACGLRRGLRPLDAAARDIAALSATSLQPIADDQAPRELMPLVASINELTKRLSDAFGAQRRFLADAAHELRTPVTALRLQHQLLECSTDEASWRESLRELERGIDRSQRLVEQLLVVARAEPDGEALRLQDIALDALVKDVVGRFSARADRLSIDLGASPMPDPLSVQGDREQLTVLLNNLVDNALRYTPAGGTVDVGAALVGGRVVLMVTDSGPGIPLHERARVLDRFHRGALAAEQARDPHGSGLGLAMVKAIAERHGARLALADPPSGHGLQVSVAFPAAGPPAPTG
jgi:two-component system OmpR family sensor kinase